MKGALFAECLKALAETHTLTHTLHSHTHSLTHSLSALNLFKILTLK